jgi:hypothetical protein
MTLSWTFYIRVSEKLHPAHDKGLSCFIIKWIIYTFFRAVSCAFTMMTRMKLETRQRVRSTATPSAPTVVEKIDVIPATSDINSTNKHGDRRVIYYSSSQLFTVVQKEFFEMHALTLLLQIIPCHLSEDEQVTTFRLHFGSHKKKTR